MDNSSADTCAGGATDQPSASPARGLARKLWRKLTGSSKKRRASQVSSSHADSQLSIHDTYASAGEEAAMADMYSAVAPSQPRMETIYSAGASGALTRAGSSIPLPAVNSSSLPLSHAAAGDARSNALRLPLAFAIGGDPANRDGGGYVPVNSAYAPPPPAATAWAGSDSSDSAFLARGLIRHGSMHGHSAASGGIVPPPSIAPETPHDPRDLEYRILSNPVIQVMLPMIPVRPNKLSAIEFQHLQPRIRGHLRPLPV
jgi:hypothetical protein